MLRQCKSAACCLGLGEEEEEKECELDRVVEWYPEQHVLQEACSTLPVMLRTLTLRTSWYEKEAAVCVCVCLRGGTHPR